MSATLECGSDQFVASLSDESTRSCDFQLNEGSLVNDSGVECLEENKQQGYRSPYVYHQSNYYYANSYQQQYQLCDNYAPAFNQMSQQYNYYDYNYGSGSQMGYARNSPLESDSFGRSSAGFLNSSLLSSSIDSGKSITPPPPSSSSSMPLSVQTESSNSISNTAPKHSSPSLITTCAPIQLNNVAAGQFQTDFTFNATSNYKSNTFYDGYAPYKYSNDSMHSFNQTSDANEQQDNERDGEEDEEEDEEQQKDGDIKKNGKQSPKKESTKKYKRRTRTTFTKTQVSVIFLLLSLYYTHTTYSNLKMLLSKKNKQ